MGIDYEGYGRSSASVTDAENRGSLQFLWNSFRYMLVMSISPDDRVKIQKHMKRVFPIKHAWTLDVWRSLSKGSIIIDN